MEFLKCSIPFVCPCRIVVSGAEAFDCLPHCAFLVKVQPSPVSFLPFSFLSSVVRGLRSAPSDKLRDFLKVPVANWPKQIYLWLIMWKYVCSLQLLEGSENWRSSHTSNSRQGGVMKASLRLYHTRIWTSPHRGTKTVTPPVLWTSWSPSLSFESYHKHLTRNRSLEVEAKVF